MHRLPRARLALVVVVALLAPAGLLRADESLVLLGARHILVAFQGSQGPQSTRSKEEALARAQEVVAALGKPGADFRALSHSYSDDKGSDLAGGSLGVFGLREMDPAFEQAVRALKVGQVSGVVESSFGFHVIQRLSLEEARKLFAEPRAAFIGARFPFGPGQDPQGLPSKERALEQAKKAVSLLRAGAAFEDLSREVGALPFPRPEFMAKVHVKGTILPAYKPLEDAVFSTAEGAVSDPFETPAGWLMVRRVPYFHAHVQHLVVMHIKSVGVSPDIRRTPEEAKARAEEALARLRKDPGSWSKVVAEYSDEPGAAARDGALDQHEPGVLAPEFDEAIVKTAPGTISLVVPSRFGFHILRRLD